MRTLQRISVHAVVVVVVVVVGTTIDAAVDVVVKVVVVAYRVRWALASGMCRRRNVCLTDHVLVLFMLT